LSFGERLIRFVSGNPALEKVADRLSAGFDAVIDAVPERERVLDALHGTWLGHPLHPVLTDLPIGAWAFAGFLDALSIGDEETNPGADAAIGFGIATAIPTAIAGAADWRQTGGESKRIGVAHALLNSGALSCYLASMLLRPQHAGLARLFGFAGLGFVGVSGYLGGHLMASAGVGIKHESEATAPEDTVPVIGDAELPEDTPTQVEVNGLPVMLVRHAGAVYALADICPHLGCSLSQGALDGDAIVCGCHGSTFALSDGRVLKGPSAYPVDAFEISRSDGSIRVGPKLELEAIREG
jgi:nitrite reductase/ring-hydroxylating ferredoxin subunit